MLPKDAPNRVQEAFAAMGTVNQFLRKYMDWVAAADDDVCDFAVGNPHEMPLPEFVDAFAQSVTPQDKDWYAYKLNEPESTTLVSSALNQQFGRPYEPDDIFMTNGATGALDVSFNVLLDFGDEVIFNSPPWFFYEGMIRNVGGVPVRVKIDPESFDLDVDAIEAAITPKTRFVLVNSPNNPTGKIYAPATLQRLADVLTQASKKHGRTIYLLSDEAYRTILFDDNPFFSPTSYYPESLMVYTYGKTLLTPGQRIGYIAISPEMAERAEMRNALFSTQIMSGFAMTSALSQHALPAIHSLSIDIGHLQEKRDLLVNGLREIGYQVDVPEATFYLMPRSPIADDVAFTDQLAAVGVLCLPGATVEMPGYFRLSLTATVEMIERALPRFAAIRDQAAA